METYINLGERFILDKKEKHLIDTETGQIYSEKEEIYKVLEQIKNDKQYNRTMEKAIREIWGLKTELEQYHLNWKSDSWFIKIYRTEMREYLKEISLSSYAGLVLFYIQNHIEYKTNRVVNKNNKSFTNKELIKLTKISENTLIDVLNELEEKLFIKKVGKRRAREIYFNPYLATAGNEVDKEVVKMFDDYKPITPY